MEPHLRLLKRGLGNPNRHSIRDRRRRRHRDRHSESSQVYLGGAQRLLQKSFLWHRSHFQRGTTGTVIVKETTKEAFLTMIDFIYEKNIYWASKTVEELFDILNISKRYQLDDLTFAINNHFKDFPFTLSQFEWSRRHNPLKVVAFAEEFEQFPDEKKSLFDRAAIFLKEKLTTTDEMLSFLDGTSFEHRDLAVRLLKEVKKLSCDQCKWNPCQQVLKIFIISKLVS